MKISRHGSKRSSRLDPRVFSSGKYPDKMREILNRKKNLSVSFALNLARRMWEDIDSPTTLGLWLCAKYGDLKSIIGHEIDPHDYIDASTFAYDWQACKLLSKLRTKVPGIDPKEVALQTFISCEQKCSVENDFWKAYSYGKCELTPYMRSLTYKVRDLVSEILGDFDLGDVLDRARFGPGTVAFTPGSQDDYIKLSSDPGYTPNLEPFLPALFREYPGWLDSLTYGGNFPLRGMKLLGGKHSLVAKSAKTDRNIEIQPSVNLFLQLGFGQVMREKLLKAGIDLSDQSRNQNLASSGSRSGKFATIDLSNASDMISSGLVEFLLPPRWYHALSALRTRNIQGKELNRRLAAPPTDWIPLNRFSSMGNGFTFELETLIFYCIARAVAGNSCTVSVYGDDIIVPTRSFTSVMGALKLFGFAPNQRKSFGDTTTFRESCGVDYFLGENVRPYFIKDIPTNDAEIVRLANGLSRSSLRRRHNYDFDEVLLRSVHYACQRLDPWLYSRIAVGFPSDDAYLIGKTYRPGYRIIAMSSSRKYTNWYPAKALCLYRVRSRYMNREDTGSSIGSFSRVSGVEAITVFRADHFDPILDRFHWGPQPDESILAAIQNSC